MPVYWENSVGGIEEVNSNIEEDDDKCEIQKPQMKNDEDKKTDHESSNEHNLFF
jgi:hypothetical protein